MRIKTMALGAVACFLGMAPSSYAQFGGAVYCTNCSAEWTQLTMKVQQAMQYVKEVQTALAAIQMAQIAAREGVNLAKHPSTNLARDLMTLSTVLQASQGLAGDMATLDAQYRSQFSPYSTSPLTSYAAAYNKWAAGTLHTLQGTLWNAGSQTTMLNNQQLWIAQVEMMNKLSMGRNESLQLGNTIGLQMVKSLMQMQQLMISDINSKQAVATTALNAQQAQQQAQQQGFYYPGVIADTRTY